jgi:hypothetical protein
MIQTGTTPEENKRRWPGDELIALPGFVTTRAVDITVPPEQVWPWLTQMGRDGTGFYGRDGLTNQGKPSAAYLREDLPPLEAGERLDDGTRALQVEANQWLLAGGFELEAPLRGWVGGPIERTTLFWLGRKADGGTRLVVRVRGYTYGALGPLLNRAYEVFDHWNGTAQIETVREYAETLARLSAGVGE